MAKLLVVFALMVLLAVFVEGRDWRFFTSKRIKRGYNRGLGSAGTYGRSDEQNASREELSGCSDESDRGYRGSREQLGYSRDGGYSNENHHGHRSFNKASASATATASSKHHNLAA